MLCKFILFIIKNNISSKLFIEIVNKTEAVFLIYIQMKDNLMME